MYQLDPSGVSVGLFLLAFWLLSKLENSTSVDGAVVLKGLASAEDSTPLLSPLAYALAAAKTQFASFTETLYPEAAKTVFITAPVIKKLLVSPDSVQVVEPLTFASASAKAYLLSHKASLSTVNTKGVYTTARGVWELLSAPECAPAVEPLIVGLAFRQPVSASSISAHLSTEEHAEAVASQRVELALEDLPPLPPETFADFMRHPGSLANFMSQPRSIADFLRQPEMARLPTPMEPGNIAFDPSFEMSDRVLHYHLQSFNAVRDGNSLAIQRLIPHVAPNFEAWFSFACQYAGVVEIPVTSVLTYITYRVFLVLQPRLSPDLLDAMFNRAMNCLASLISGCRKALRTQTAIFFRLLDTVNRAPNLWTIERRLTAASERVEANLQLIVSYYPKISAANLVACATNAWCRQYVPGLQFIEGCTHLSRRLEVSIAYVNEAELRLRCALSARAQYELLQTAICLNDIIIAVVSSLL